MSAIVLLVPLAAVAAMSAEDRDATMDAAGKQSTGGGMTNGSALSGNVAKGVPLAPTYGTKPGLAPVSAPAITSKINKSGMKPINPYLTKGPGIYTTASVTSTQSKIDQELAKVKAEYDKLPSEAKKKGADVLNKALNLSPPLTGKESWSTIVERSSEAAGRKACDAVPGVSLASGACAAVAAYLGKDLHKLLAGVWNTVDAVADEVWDAAKKAGGAVEDAANKVISIFT